VISPALLERVACPVCLEGAGCPACGRAAGHQACADYTARAGCGCGGPDKRQLARDAGGLRCPCCRAVYELGAGGGFLDLRPAAWVGDVTHYADHAFHERLGVVDAPPVLSARIKADQMRRMLDPRPGEAVLDLGCGAGKFALFANRNGVRTTGLDLAPYFLPRALEQVDLVAGDLRRLPFRKAAFPKAYTLDVLEHLDENGVREVLLEARRVLAPDGRLFVYTHAMESSRIAGFQRAVNRLARRLGRAGLIDHERESLRKSDHVNAILSHEHFDALSAGAGLRVVRRRYYNVVFKAVIEDLLLRLVQRARQERAGGQDGDQVHASSEADGRGRALVPGPPPGRVSLGIARAATLLLRLDVALFGSVRTGPFFGLLQPR
jgi:ubiquinone/menaquinone biosynthesis C-methylase UbiE